MQTLPANRTFRKQPRQAAGCKGSTGEQATPRTAGIVTNGFLKQQFLPLYQPSAQVPEQLKVEAIYLQSAGRLSDYYDIEVMDVTGYAYPYNILLSQWDITRKLRVKERRRELLLQEAEGQATQLSVREYINTGSTLYYIPLESLYKALQDANAICAELLLGVCTYLYIKAGVCHYRDGESYLCYLYDIMGNWIEDDRESMDDLDYDEQRAILDESLAVGDKMSALLSNEHHLLRLGEHVRQFSPTNRFENRCLQLAKNTLSVWTEHPQADIYQHIAPRSEQDEEEDYYGNGKIRVNEYISFIGETTSHVYDTMINMANDEFNERSGVEDFETLTVFDKNCGKYKDGLIYEEKVIAIIDQLCNLIEEMP